MEVRRDEGLLRGGGPGGFGDLGGRDVWGWCAFDDLVELGVGHVNGSVARQVLGGARRL